MQSHTTKNKFCIRPFTDADIRTSGKLRTCCEIQPNLSKFKGQTSFNVKEGFDKFWNSPYRKYLIDSFLNDKKLDECKNCWMRESKNLESHREAGNRKHKILFKKNYEKHIKQLNKWNLESPQDMTFAITNLCNLKCQMCKGMFSSPLLNENLALGFEKNISQKDFDWDKGTKINFIKNLLKHDLKHLTILGGEPFIVPEIVKILAELSKKLKVVEEIDLTIFSNGTNCNLTMYNILKQFKHLKLIISMDSTHKNNDYVRYPSDWNLIKENIKLFKKMPYVELMINATVQNLTILYLDRLINFAYENEIHLILYPISEPTYLQFDNLPVSVLEKSFKKLSKIKKERTIHVTNFDNLLTLLEDKISNGHTTNEKEYNKFVTMIKARDKYRNISIKNYMPELAQEIFE